MARISLHNILSTERTTIISEKINIHLHFCIITTYTSPSLLQFLHYYRVYDTKVSKYVCVCVAFRFALTYNYKHYTL